MGFWEEVGDAILSIGQPVLGFGLGFWVIVGIIALIVIAIILFFG